MVSTGTAAFMNGVSGRKIKNGFTFSSEVVGEIGECGDPLAETSSGKSGRARKRGGVGGRFGMAKVIGETTEPGRALSIKSTSKAKDEGRSGEDGMDMGFVIGSSEGGRMSGAKGRLVPRRDLYLPPDFGAIGDPSSSCEGPNISSAGMFSPKVRVSLCN